MERKKHGRHLQPEECGVWLNTAEPKKKSQQTFIPCKFYKHLNPRSRKQNSNSAVFDFTQTKTLCTKQTSINAFFVPKSKTKLQPSRKGNLISSPREKENAVDDTKPLSIGSSLCLNPSHSVDHTCYQDAYSCVSFSNTQKHVHVCENAFSKSGSLTDADNLYRTDVELSHSYTLPTDEKNSEILSHSPVCPFYPDGCKILYTECHPDSQLFTQDTQENQVIAHRSTITQQKRLYLYSPLHDRANTTWGNTSPLKKNHQYLSDEDSPQNMFTQDSEGNMVIKH